MIKLLVLDFDGVFTDGKVTFHDKGGVRCCSKSYNVKDGMGLKLLKKHGIHIGVISGYPYNEATMDICKHLDINNLEMECHDKLEVLRKWAKQLNIDLSHIAYMGDDVNDVECMKSVGISGCPSDAVEECKQIARFVSTSRGGDGAIREFSNFIINVVPRLKGISALVCVKLNSSRCPYKNIRRFANTTLIDHKLNVLSKCKFLEYIVFNTDNEELIEYVKNKHSGNLPNLKIVKREKKYATDEVDNFDFCKNVTSDFPSDYVLYTPVTMPFITVETYNNMYDRIIEDKNDSIVLAADGEQGGGHANEKHKICFAASIISVQDVQKHGDFIGYNPYFQECTLKERMDIDFPDEFNSALYHAFNRDAVYGSEYFKNVSLYKMEELSKFDKNDGEGRVFNSKAEAEAKVIGSELQIIDVTTRDGGFANEWSFTIQEVEDMLKCASDTGIDIFEIGYLMNQEICKKEDGVWRNVDFNLISQVVNKVKPKCKISAMIDYWRYDIDKLVPHSETKIDLIRITCYMHKIQECVDYCKKVYSKGYDVSLNVMCGSYFTDDVISDVIEKITENKDILKYAYVADTYGAMNPFQIRHIYSKLVPALHACDIKVGFHIHNNGQVAMANTFEALEQGVDIIDGSYGGMGRGAGNLFLEYIVLYLSIHENFGSRTIKKCFDVKPFLNFMDKKYKSENKINQIDDVKYALMGFFNAHPYRLRDFDENVGLYELYKALEEMPVQRKFDYLLG